MFIHLLLFVLSCICLLWLFRLILHQKSLQTEYLPVVPTCSLHLLPFERAENGQLILRFQADIESPVASRSVLSANPMCAATFFPPKAVYFQQRCIRLCKPKIFRQSVVISMPLQCPLSQIPFDFEVLFHSFHRQPPMRTAFRIPLQFPDLFHLVFPTFSRQVSIPDCNILLFGPVSSGKSSFVNSCFSLLSSHRLHNVALVGSQNHFHSKTVHFQQFRLGKKHAVTNLVLWDTPGAFFYQNARSFQDFVLQKSIHAVLFFCSTGLTPHQLSLYSQFCSDHCILSLFICPTPSDPHVTSNTYFLPDPNAIFTHATKNRTEEGLISEILHRAVCFWSIK